MKEFFKAQFSTKNDHHVELAVLACIDPRFREFDQQAIEEGLGVKNFDLFRWPGVTKPLLNSQDFFELFCQAITKVSIGLHHIKKLMLLCHWDCGGYGGSCAFGSCQEEEAKYQVDLLAAKESLQKRFPELELAMAYSKLGADGFLHYYQI